MLLARSVQVYRCRSDLPEFISVNTPVEYQRSAAHFILRFSAVGCVPLHFIPRVRSADPQRRIRHIRIAIDQHASFYIQHAIVRIVTCSFVCSTDMQADTFIYRQQITAITRHISWCIAVCCNCQTALSIHLQSVKDIPICRCINRIILQDITRATDRIIFLDDQIVIFIIIRHRPAIAIQASLNPFRMGKNYLAAINMAIKSAPTVLFQIIQQIYASINITAISVSFLCRSGKCTYGCNIDTICFPIFINSFHRAGFCPQLELLVTDDQFNLLYIIPALTCSDEIIRITVVCNSPDYTTACF